MKFDWIRLVLGALLNAAIAVNFAFVPAAVAQALEPLAMSYLPGNAIAWDLDVAMDRGLFKAEGFDGKPVVFQNAPQSAQMLITGEVQLGTGQIDPFLLAFRSDARDIAVIAILQKYTKRETPVMEAVYDLFIGKDRLYTMDAAVDVAGVDTEIATMIEKGVVPPGTTMLPQDYMLPRELGGLYR